MSHPFPGSGFWGMALRAAVLLAVCVVVYWVGLGTGGFHSTEAHRAVPAYEMLDHAEGPSDWLVPRMFEQPYLRKPPGMPWAIAGVSAVLGQTVFAARAVSALASTLMAVLAFGFGWRWFGRAAALPAGLVCALMPVLWESGRAAEIEALNNLGTQIAVLGLIDLLVFLRLRGRAGLLVGGGVSALFAAFGVVWFVLAKGPASVPVVVGAVAGACLALRSARPLFGSLWIVLGLSGLPIGLGAWLIARAAGAEDVPPVTQSPSAFMFEPGMLLGVVALPFASFVQMLPASFALLFPWGGDARGESEQGVGGWSADRHRVARALAFAWLVAVGVFMVFGVRNPRYTLPASVLLAPLAGAYLSGVGVWLGASRRRVVSVMTLGRPVVLAGLLLIGSLVYGRTIEASRRSTSAGPVGERIARDLVAELPGESGFTLIADGVIEARPELVWSLERSLQRSGRAARAVWTPSFSDKITSENNNTIMIGLFRAEPGSVEAGLVESGALPLNLARPLSGGDAYRFHKYSVIIYLLGPRGVGGGERGAVKNTD